MSKSKNEKKPQVYRRWDLPKWLNSKDYQWDDDTDTMLIMDSVGVVAQRLLQRALNPSPEQVEEFAMEICDASLVAFESYLDGIVEENKNNQEAFKDGLDNKLASIEGDDKKVELIDNILKQIAQGGVDIDGLKYTPVQLKA